MVELEFEVKERWNGKLRIRTTGMARRGRPEMEIADVAPAQAAVARELLTRVARVASKSPVVDGALLSLGDEISVELEESEHVPAGFLARTLGGSDLTVMRVTDAGATTADAALSSTARTRASELVAGGDVTGAARLLTEAMESLDPCNHTTTGERARVCLQLCRVERDPARAFEHFLAALRLSTDTQITELGATFAELAAVEQAQLTQQMQRIATINLGLVGADEALDNTLRVVPCPIWERTDGTHAQLAMTTIPSPWLRLYWSGPTREDLENGTIPRMAARIFVRNARNDDTIARMAFVAHTSIVAFTAHPDSPRAFAAPGEVEPHTFLASAVLAHVARLRTAGLTATEVDAAFGLNHDPEAKLLAKDRERRLRVRLAQWTHDRRSN
jgi:hypothetical protein